jgi:5-methylcytosine-specific restriction endonuclease McrA
LVLVLDHINGDRSDNRITNLRLLCPNCNSQQNTFAGRNKGRYRAT